MWSIILGYLLVSALFALLFWIVLIVARRKDENDVSEHSEEESADRELDHIVR